MNYTKIRKEVLTQLENEEAERQHTQYVMAMEEIGIETL